MSEVSSGQLATTSGLGLLVREGIVEQAERLRRIMAIPIHGVFTNLGLQLLLDELLNGSILRNGVGGPKLRLLAHIRDQRFGARDLPFFVLHPKREAADGEAEHYYTGRYY